MKAILVVAIFAFSGVAYSSEWNFAGYTENIGTAKDRAYQFYDSESISRPSTSTVRVWIKSISTTTLDQYTKKNEKQVIEDSAKKIAKYYIPNFLTLPAIAKKYNDKEFLNATVELTSSEVAANLHGIPQLHKMYFEIDCKEKRIRLLSITAYDKKGNFERSRDRPDTEWAFLSPDSTGLWLSQMVCK